MSFLLVLLSRSHSRCAATLPLSSKRTFPMSKSSSVSMAAGRGKSLNSSPSEGTICPQQWSSSKASVMSSLLKAQVNGVYQCEFPVNCTNSTGVITLKELIGRPKSLTPVRTIGHCLFLPYGVVRPLKVDSNVTVCGSDRYFTKNMINISITKPPVLSIDFRISGLFSLTGLSFCCY